MNSLLLRYVDAVQFDYLSEDFYVFLREKLKVDIKLPDTLFAATGVERLPRQFNWVSSFRCQNPSGIISVRFATGSRPENIPVLLWEIGIHTAERDMPMMPDGFSAWLEAAHSITDQWFFTLIAGDLEREFNDN